MILPSLSDKFHQDLRKKVVDPGDTKAQAMLANLRSENSTEDIEDPSEAGPSASTVAAFTLRIHHSLNTQQVAMVAVNELRNIVGCDRVCFLDRVGTQYRLRAASDQLGIPPRLRQRSLLEQFVTMAIPTGRRLLFPDGDTTLPDHLSRLLAAYWENSAGQMILVEPVFSRLPDPNGRVRTPSVGPIVGALVIERFNVSTPTPGGLHNFDSAMEHVTLALANARRYSRLATVPGLWQLGQIFELLRQNRSLALMTYLLLLVGIITGSYWVERPFEVESDGRLMPKNRREVFAAVDGEIVDVLVGESDHVDEGQIIARLQSRELEKSLLEQTGWLKGKLKARDAARADLRTRSTPQVRGQSARDQAQLEVINSEIETIERQIELLEQERVDLVIRAPIAGTITTDRPRERLLGRPVHRGESLLEIMDETGEWQLELSVAEKTIGHLLSYHQHHSDVGVKFRLRLQAQESYDCQVTRMADRMFASAELGTCGHVFCDVTKVNLATRQIGSEVRAKIQCGNKNLLFIVFHEFWELLRRHWWI